MKRNWRAAVVPSLEKDIFESRYNLCTNKYNTYHCPLLFSLLKSLLV